MSDISKIITFQNGLNTDVSKEYMPLGSSDLRINCDITSIGEEGIIVNANGNKIIPLFDMPSGYNETIKAFNDLKTNSIIYWVYNENNLHSILRLNCKDDTIDKIIFADPTLNLNLNYPVKIGGIVNGVIYWVDGNNENRHLDIERAIAFTNGGDNPYLRITDEELNVINVLPIRRMFVYSFYEQSIQTNNLIGKLCKFACKYIYYDNTESKYSPISPVVLPDYNLGIEAVKINQTGDNAIKLVLERGSNEVKYIEVIFKCNSDVWKTVDRYDRGDTNDLLCINFYNNFNYAAVLESDVQAGFDNIPIHSNDCAILPDTYLSFSGNQMFEDSVKLDVSVNKLIAADKLNLSNIGSLFYDGSELISYNVMTNGDDIQKTAIVDWNTFITNISGKGMIGVNVYGAKFNCFKYFRYSTIPDLQIARDYIQKCIVSELSDLLTIDNDIIYFNKTKYYNTFDDVHINLTVYNNPVSIDDTGLSWLLKPNPGGQLDLIAISGVTLDNSVNYTIHYTFQKKTFVGLDSNDPPYVIRFYKSEPLSLNDMNFFASGSSYDPSGTVSVNGDGVNCFITINRYDTDVFGDAYKIYPTTIPVTSQNEVAQECFKGQGQFGVVYYDKYKRNIGINTEDNLNVSFPYNIENTVGIKGNALELIINNPPSLKAKYFQIFYTGNLSFNYQLMGYGVVATDTFGTYIKIDILKDVLSIKDAVNSSYVFEDGDYLSIFGKLGVKAVSAISTRYFKIIGQLDVANLDRVYLSADIFEFTDKDLFCEIIRPTKLTPSLFYECSPIFDIIEVNGNRYHSGNIQNQGNNTPAKIYLTKGDYYRIRKRLFLGDYDNSINFVESSHQSNFYKSDYWANGRINVPIQQVGGGFLNNTLMSNKYVPNTQMNGLSTFEWQESTNEANEKNGIITKSIVVGDIFYTIQKDKITSYYIGREVGGKNSNGSDIIYVIDSVLGKMREEESMFGTMHPDSITSFKNYVYGYDANQRCIWRKATNGEVDISSKYGIAFLLNEISDKVLADPTRYKVTSHVSVLMGIIYFTFKDKSYSNESYTICFLEDQNQWITEYSFIPEMYAGIADLYTFKGGQIFKHTTDANKCTYYGIKYPQRIKIVFNEQWTLVKVMDWLAISSNVRWDIKCSIAPSFTYKNGMYTEIKAEQLEHKEGKFFKEFPRNMKSKQRQIVRDQLITGDKMRGQVMEIILENWENGDVYLSNIEVNSSKSL